MSSTTKRRKPEPYFRSGKHQAALDRKGRSAKEIRFKEIYGKWPSALELQQAMPFLRLKPINEKEE